MPLPKKMFLKTIHPVRLKYFILLAFITNLQSALGSPNIHCPIGFIQTEEKTVGISCFQIKSHETYFDKYKRCSDNMVPLTFYEATNDHATALGKEAFWTDYVRAYEDGPFINWQLGNKDMGKPIPPEDMENWDTNSLDGSNMCSIVSLTSKKFTAVKCNETYSRFCYVKTYDDSDPMMWNCPDGYISFGSPVPSCLITPSGEFRTSRNTPLRATWQQASQFCNKSSGHLLHRGYIYTNHPEFTSEQFFNWELPLGIRKEGENYLWVGHKEMKDDELIPSAEWLFDPQEKSNTQATHVSLENQRWILRDSLHLYYYTICEYFVQLPVLRMQLSINGTDNSSIILEVDQPSITEEQILCFTDSVKHYPERVSVTLVKDITGASIFRVETKGNGYYWCLTSNTKEYTWKESEKLLFVYPNYVKETCAVTVRLHQEGSRQISPNTYLNIIKNEIDNYKINALGSQRNTGKRKPGQSQYVADSEASINISSDAVIKRMYSNDIILFHVDGKECLSLLTMEMRLFNILSVKKVWRCEGFDTIPTTNIGGLVLSDDGCFKFNCMGDFNSGGSWKQISDFPDRPEFCFDLYETTSTTEYSYNTTQTAESSTTMVSISPDDQVTNVLNNLQDILNGPVEIVQLTSATNQISDLLSLPDGVMIPPSILQTMDSIIDKLDFPLDKSNVMIVDSNLAIVVTKTEGNEAVSGIKLTMIGEGPLNETSLKLLFKDDEVPNDSSSDIIVKVPSNLSDKRSRLSFTVLRNDRAFKKTEARDSIKVNSRIVSITLSDTSHFSNDEFIDIYFKPFDEFGSTIDGIKTCSFWDFESEIWSSEGCELHSANNTDELDVCRCNHLTHFAQIISNKGNNFSESNEHILMIISYIGCTVSLLGLIVIGLTGLIFKSWRRDFINKIWLHLSAAVSIMIISFLVIASVNFKNNDPTLCVAFGVTLHYSVIASFCWMLISAVLSYERLVTVFATNSSHRLLKSCVFGWIAPIVPVGLLLAVDYDNYSLNSVMGQTEFCYPSGLGYWLTVFMPIVVIVVANTGLFFTIIYSVFISPSIQRHGDTKQLYSSITVSFLLFFLFGLTWLFGLFSYNLFMAYLFCITATIQGFVLFLFFVLGNKKARDLWLVFLRCKDSRATAVTSTMSRSLHSRGQNGAGISHIKFDDGDTNKPRSLSGNTDNSRFS